MVGGDIPQHDGRHHVATKCAELVAPCGYAEKRQVHQPAYVRLQHRRGDVPYARDDGRIAVQRGRGAQGAWHRLLVGHCLADGVVVGHIAR